MMQRLVPPLCFLLALAMLVSAISMLAVGAPDESVELHAARVRGDDAFVDVWEEDLQRRRRWRQMTIGALLIGSVAMVWNAFRAMK